jgi:hypothetical protein
MQIALAALALLLSDTAPAQSAPPAELGAFALSETGPQMSRSATPPAMPAATDTERPAPVEISIEGGAGTRGEGSLAFLMRWQGERLALGLGAEGSTGPLAPARQGLIAQAELSIAPAALRAELRARPPQAGAARLAGELGLRAEGRPGSVDLAVRALSARASAPAFSRVHAHAGAGAAAELTVFAAALEAQVAVGEALLLGLRLAAAATELRWRGRAPVRPWEALGSAILEWPDRWEALASLRAQAGDFAIAVAAGGAVPAVPGAVAARASLRMEMEGGPATLSLSVGAAHQWPEGLWLGDLGFAAAFRLGRDSAQR